MEFQQYLMQQWQPVPSEKPTSCFDCNICLDFARDPVVTLCGHLYCWPCIYKWVDSQAASLPLGQLPQCPVCKAETSEKTLVPLYGRGQIQSLPDPQHGETGIPPRPPASGIQGLVELFNPDQGQLSNPNHYPYPYRHNNRRYSPNYSSDEGGAEPPPSLSTLRGIAPLVLTNPVVEMLGGMVYARVSGNSTSLYTYPNSYHSTGNSTPRQRRRELQAEKSLNRVTLFLFCCLVLFLLLF